MRTVLIVLVAVVALLVVAAIAAGWVFSSRFLVPAPYALMPEFEVIAADDASVTLPAPAQDAPQFARTRAQGVYNLVWEDGYGRLGPVVSDDGDAVTRELARTDGRAPAAGDPARLDVTVFRRDPERDHGIAFEELRLPGEAGELAAWWIPGGEQAVLMVHGRRRADRTEALRILPTLVEMGYAVLVLAWRNHDASDPSPDGLYRYGATEYRDVLTGAEFLAGHGVTGMAVYGFSTGANLGLEAARRWPEGAPALEALVLDSPLVDLATTVRASARAQGLPDALTSVALGVGGLRAGVRWSELDQRRSAASIETPLLVFAGTADSTTPVDVVDAFVANAGAPVRYERLEGVEHVEGWNVDPAGYEAAVRAFLDDVMPAR